MGNEISTRPPSLLVGCHRRMVKMGKNQPNPISDHYLSEYIQFLVDQYDIQYTYSADLNHPCFPHKYDLFTAIDDQPLNESRKNKWRNYFKVVFLPDCDGNWAGFQEKNNVDGMIQLIRNVFTYISDTGVLVVSKIVKDNLFNQVNQVLESDYIIVKQNIKFSGFNEKSFTYTRKWDA